MNLHHAWKTSGGLAVLAIAVFTLSITSRAGDRDDRHDNDRDDQRKIEIGQRIAPVPLDFRRKDRNDVYLGSYIVNAMGGCNDCHTAPPYADGGDPFQGQPKKFNSARYLGGGSPFGPTVTSRNITPDVNGRPAGLTFPEFVQAMRTGFDKDHVHGPNVPLQVMPWPVYQSMTNGDLDAIYTYLSAIPCLEGDPGVNPNAPPRCH